MRQRHSRITGSNEIDFDQAGIGPEHFFLLLKILLPPQTSEFVGRTKKFKNGYYFSSVALSNFNVTFGHWFVTHFEDKWFRDGSAFIFTATNCLASHSAAVDLGNMNVGNNHTADFGLGFQKNTLFHPGAQIGRQRGLEYVAGVLDQTVMDVTPLSLQVRVHAWKRTLHEINYLRPSRVVQDFAMETNQSKRRDSTWPFEIVVHLNLGRHPTY